jgi:pimeloyl-ACP methyl ester carboxylesterase
VVVHVIEQLEILGPARTDVHVSQYPDREDTVTEISDVRYARSADGIDIAYQTVGHGPLDIVFVSGFISHLDFNWEFPWFSGLLAFDGFARIVMFDKRGTGLSDRSLGFGSVADRSDDIRAVMDAAGIERAALWGMSEGGPLSILFAATYPQRASHLILYGSGARFAPAPGYKGIDRWQTAEKAIAQFSEDWGTGRAYGLFIQDAPDTQETERALARFERNACTPQMVRQILRSNMDIDIRSMLPTINVPTLVLHNVGDPMVPVEIGRYLARHIPRARYLEGTGNCHGSWLPEHMFWIVPPIYDFLGGRLPEPAPLDRVLATVLFTDIVRSTERTASLGDRSWRELLDRHDQAAKNQVDRYRGRLVNTTGDGLLATFDSPARGIQCAEATKKST